MITGIVIENFKCFRKVEVNPRLITVFIGPNGSGKSSVLQALALLKQSMGGDQLKLQGTLVNLRSYEQIKPNFDANGRELRLGFKGSYDAPPSPIREFGGNVRFSYDSEFVDGRLDANWGSLSFALGGSTYTLEITKDGTAHPLELPMEGLVAGLGPNRAIAQVLYIIRSTGQAQARYGQFIELNVLAAPSRVLEQLRLVPAARGLVQPVYNLGPNVVNDVSLIGGLSQQELQTATNLAYTRSLEGKLSGWLKQVTGVGLRADMVPAQQVEVQAITPAGEVNIISEGFGANALILLYWQLASADNGATVMIEEPEIHLHPRAQAELASVLVEVAKAETKQVIMTTHSEHILGRLLTLVAEKSLSLDELAIYAFEKDEKGVCTANQLEVVEDGRVKGDIKDFFEPHLEELNRYVRALQSRQ